VPRTTLSSHRGTDRASQHTYCPPTTHCAEYDCTRWSTATPIYNTHSHTVQTFNTHTKTLLQCSHGILGAPCLSTAPSKTLASTAAVVEIKSFLATMVACYEQWYWHPSARTASHAGHMAHTLLVATLPKVTAATVAGGHLGRPPQFPQAMPRAAYAATLQLCVNTHSCITLSTRLRHHNCQVPHSLKLCSTTGTSQWFLPGCPGTAQTLQAAPPVMYILHNPSRY
jgi:hypothetical protein